LKRFKGKFDALSMAVAFAEVGEWKTAEQILDELKPLNENGHPKLLFVTAADAFANSSIHYAVNLASRLKFDLLAMKVFQPSALKHFPLRSRRREIERCLAVSRESMSLLREKTLENNVRCDHAVLCEDLGTTIRKVSQIIRRIEVIVIQMQQNERLTLDLAVPVFRVLPKEAGY